MRIVHLYKDYFPPVRGGIEQTLHRMATAQVRAGHQVTVMVSASGSRRSSTESLDGVEVARVGEWARVWSTPLCPGMPRHVADQRADIWHLHYPSPPGEISWLLARRREAAVMTYHSDIVRQRAVMPIYGSFARAVLRRLDLIMPTSDSYQERSSMLREFRDKCRVVPLGIDLAPFDRLEHHRSEGEGLKQRYGTPLVVFVGKLRHYKGLDVLIDAMSDVRASLVIVGDGPVEREVRERIAARGLGDRVFLAGAVAEDRLMAFLAAADVGVLPSTQVSEALGMALVEFMAAGVPVVCTELGTGTTFVNRHGETGYVVAPGNARELGSAIGRLLADESLRRRFGAAARRRAHEVFSLEAMMRGVDNVYAEALHKRDKARKSP